MLPYEQKTVFLSELKCFAVSNVTTRVRMLSFGIDTHTIALPLVYCPVDDTFFEVGPGILCSGVSSR